MPKRETREASALTRVRAICLALPEAEEKISHGAPTFHVRGKTFVMFLDNHHGDGRLAIWCKASFDAQHGLVSSDPDRYFVPPYVGKSGWVGVRLDRKKSDWEGVRAIAEDGWRMIAPKRLLREDK